MNLQSVSSRLFGGRARKLVVVIAVVALLAIPASYVLATDTFSDVPNSPASQHTAVNALVDAGITAGCNQAGTKYCPTSAVTRGQMAIFMDRLGHLSGLNSAFPVVDALTLDGQAIVGFEEPFDLAGGSPLECEATTSVGFLFGEYAVQHQLFDVDENVGETAIGTDEIIVSIVDDPNADDDDYQVCFRRVTAGNLPAGTYDTYGTFSAFVGSGFFGTGANAGAKIAQFRQAKNK